MQTEYQHCIRKKNWRRHLVDFDLHALPILSDSLDNVFVYVENRLCIANSVLSDKNSTDDKEKYRTGDVAHPNHSPWDVVAIHD